MTGTIAFLVKKAAQFDVPLFRFIERNTNNRWRWLVIYLENPNESSTDAELKESSKWGINLIDGYNWEWLGESPTAKAIQELYRKWKVDFLISNGYKHGYAPFVRQAKRFAIPIGLRIDSVLFGKSKKSLLLRKYLMRWRYRDFCGFFTTGKVGYEYLDFIGIPKRKQFWFPYCVDNDFFAIHTTPLEQSLPSEKHLSIQHGQVVVLGVCKFIARENPSDLLEAFIQLDQSPWKLIIIGDGELANKLKQRAQEFPTLNIQFPGYIPYQELPNWYVTANVFVHTAQDEPWGVSVQEAIAANCAVVASTHVGSAYDLIMQGGNGFMYPVNNIDRLAACIQKAVEIPSSQITDANTQILHRWNYESVWSHLQETADRLTNSQQS